MKYVSHRRIAFVFAIVATLSLPCFAERTEARGSGGEAKPVTPGPAPLRSIIPDDMLLVDGRGMDIKGEAFRDFAIRVFARTPKATIAADNGEMVIAVLVVAKGSRYVEVTGNKSGMLFRGGPSGGRTCEDIYGPQRPLPAGLADAGHDSNCKKPQ